MPRRPRDEGATSVVLLVAVLPAVLVTFALCVNAGAVTYAWMRTDRAAQAAVQAVALEQDPVEAARGALSERLRRGARVRVTETDVTVTVVPVLLFGLGPGMPDRVRVQAPIETEETP